MITIAMTTLAAEKIIFVLEFVFKNSKEKTRHSSLSIAFIYTKLQLNLYRLA